MIVWAMRSELSRTHFWARRRMRPRPSKPSASQPGCAARARATTPATSSTDRAGTEAMTWPVAGFCTSICRVAVSNTCCLLVLGWPANLISPGLPEREGVAGHARRHAQREAAVLHPRERHQPVEALLAHGHAAAAHVLARLGGSHRAPVDEHLQVARLPALRAHHEEHLARRHTRLDARVAHRRGRLLPHVPGT